MLTNTFIDSALIAMGNPMYVWYVIVGILLLVLLCGSFRLMHRHSSVKNMHKPHFMEVGKECDIFYVPGDRRYTDDDNVSDDDF